jgi:hypothetical protein
MQAYVSRAGDQIVITKLKAVTSRTWFLKGVKTLDLVSRDNAYCSGSYAITVVFLQTWLVPGAGHTIRSPSRLSAAYVRFILRMPSEARLHLINSRPCCAAALPPLTPFLFQTETAWLMLIHSA